MKNYLLDSLIVLLTFVLLIRIPTIAAQTGVYDGGDSDGFTEVKLYINSEPNWEQVQVSMWTINVPSNGELVSVDLDIPSTLVRTAFVQSEKRRVGCFFLWNNPRLSRKTANKFVSTKFRGKMRTASNTIVERAYCYDNSRYVLEASTSIRKETFDLFLDNRRGASELIRLTLPEDETVVELDLEATYPDFYRDLRHFAYLSGPIRYIESDPSTRFDADENVCVVLTIQRGEGSRSIELGASTIFDADIRAKKIVCFFNGIEPGYEDQWRREGLWPLQ